MLKMWKSKASFRILTLKENRKQTREVKIQTKNNEEANTTIQSSK